MTEEERQLLMIWIANTQVRIENDLTEARNDFQRNENAWFAFRLAVTSERKSFFDSLTAQLYALLHV